LLQSHIFKNNPLPRNLFPKLMEVDFLESEKSKIPEPKRTANGKYKCTEDNQEYDTREDYEAHCMEEHPGEM
jgi:hypothetical protein